MPQGVTGFGSAILNLCCWIAFVVAGVDSGKLPASAAEHAYAQIVALLG
jgi:hypothetical protein